jgi:hypothetical protein
MLKQPNIKEKKSGVSQGKVNVLYLVGWGEIGERTRAGKEKSESKP